MDLNPLHAISDIIGRFKESDDEKLRGVWQQMQPLVLQLQTNLAEAQHPNFIVAGWRPAVGWICALGLLYQFAIYPLLCWWWAFAAMKGQAPPALDMDVLGTLLFTLLGVGGMRSFDKKQGTDTKQIAK